MNSLSAAAIVISRGNAEFLGRTLRAIEQQSHALSQVVVVEVSDSLECLELAKSFGFGAVLSASGHHGLAIETGVQALQGAVSWLWILHEDSAPEADALYHLAKAAEISPSVAVVGPKILDWDQPSRIRQLGLTITTSSRPFSLADGAYDQGQFDSTGDTLAVSTAGMLVAMGLWSKIGGLADNSPLLAQDIEFCIKARALGFRVIVEPRARVRSFATNSSRRFGNQLPGSRALAISKAHVHLATIMWPAAALPFLYLAMPLLVLGLIPVNLIQKRPARTLGQLGAWLYSWFTLAARLRARRDVRNLGSVTAMAQLYASREQARGQRERRYEEEPTEMVSRPGIFATRSAWLALLPLVAGYSLWPQGAILSERIIPLGSSFDSIWTKTSASYQNYLEGVLLPSDPFNWFYVFVSAIWPSTPSSALAAFVFLAPALGFFGAWLLASTLVSSTWLKNATALSYSLAAPALLLQREAGVVELVSHAFLPWTLFFLIKTAFSFNLPRAWRWLGLAGLTGSLIAVSSPLLFGFLILFSAGLGVYRIRRLGVLIWFAVPGLTLLAPWIQYAISVGNYEYLTASTLAARAPVALYLEPVWWVLLAGLGLFALLFSMWSLRLGVGIWTAVIALLFASSYQPIASSEPLLLAIALLLLLLIAVGLEGTGSKKTALTGAVTLSSLAITSALTFGFLVDRDFEFGNERVMPALVVASGDVDSSIRTLQIEMTDSGIFADLIWGDGIQQHERSLLFELDRPQSQLEPLIAQLTGSLIAGNPEGIDQLNRVLGVDFVLLRGSNPSALEAKVAMDGLTWLQPAGQTSFGQLWSVSEPNAIPSPPAGDSTTKLWQLALLVVFALLAIPTPASIRGRKLVRGWV